MNKPQTPLAIKFFLAKQGYFVKECINFDDENQWWIYNFSIEKNREDGTMEFLAIKPFRFITDEVESQLRPFSVIFEYAYAAHLNALFAKWVKTQNFKFD